MSGNSITRTDDGLAPVNETDCEAIQAAVMETSRGRWFLAEYARRQRRADTDVLLAAIDALARSMQAPPATATCNATGRFIPSFRVKQPNLATYSMAQGSAATAP